MMLLYLRKCVGSCFFLCLTVFLCISPIAQASSGDMGPLQGILEDQKVLLKRNKRCSHKSASFSLQSRNKERLHLVEKIHRSYADQSWEESLLLCIQAGFSDAVTWILDHQDLPEEDDSLRFLALEHAIEHDISHPEEDSMEPLLRNEHTKLTKKKKHKFHRRLASHLSSREEVSCETRRELETNYPLIHRSKTRFQKDSDGNLPVMEAANANNADYIATEFEQPSQRLLNTRNKYGWSLLHIAARFSDHEVIQKVLQQNPVLHRRVYSHTLNRFCFAYELLRANDKLTKSQVNELALKMQPRRKAANK